jgi:hypothetical protein
MIMIPVSRLRPFAVCEPFCWRIIFLDLEHNLAAKQAAIDTLGEPVGQILQEAKQVNYGTPGPSFPPESCAAPQCLRIVRRRVSDRQAFIETYKSGHPYSKCACKRIPCNDGVDGQQIGVEQTFGADGFPAITGTSVGSNFCARIQKHDCRRGRRYPGRSHAQFARK